MKHKLITCNPGESAQRTYAVILSTGDDFADCMLRFVEEVGASASHYTAIGAFSSAVLAYFDWERKDYRAIPIEEQVEVISLVGDVALKEGKPALHTHVTVAKSDGTAWGGHLLSGIVRPTLEIMLIESPAQLIRRHDATTGLALISMD